MNVNEYVQLSYMSLYNAFLNLGISQKSSLAYGVYEVAKDNFQSCNITNHIHTFTMGPGPFALPEPGDRFFICSNRLHCFSGVKLQVNVEGNGSSLAPMGATRAAPAGILQLSSKIPTF